MGVLDLTIAGGYEKHGRDWSLISVPIRPSELQHKDIDIKPLTLTNYTKNKYIKHPESKNLIC